MTPVQLSPLDKAIYDLACRLDSPVTPSWVADRLDIHRRTAARHLRSLKEKGFFIALGGDKKKIVRYKVAAADFRQLS